MQTTQHHALGDSSNKSLMIEKTSSAADSVGPIVRASKSSVVSYPIALGDYLLHRVLGSGGMGIVYLATQIKLERKVALKMIRSGSFASEKEVQRFYTEARSAAGLRHPNIVSVHQFGEVDGQHFFSMDFIDGEDLASRLSSGPISPPLAAKFVQDLAMAVSYAHSKGIIHRDLKPANILISRGEHVFISDFGLAKVLHSTSNATLDGTALGTPGFMSPEQASGDSKNQGQSTDIYSLGAILFASLTGQPPFASENFAQSIYAVVHQEPPLVRQIRPEIPVDLESIVSKCLCKSPQDRYASADALADDLDRFLRSQPVSARPLSPLVRVFRWARQIPIIAVMTGSYGLGNTPSHRFANGLLALFVILLGVAVTFRSPIREAYKNTVIPANVTMGVSAAANGEAFELQEFAKRFESKTGHRLSLIPSADAQSDLEQVEKGKADLSLVVATEIEPSNLVVVAPLFSETLHFVVRDRFQGRNIEELKGLRVAIGKHGSVAHQVVESLRKNVPQLFDGMLCVEIDASEILERDDLDAAVILDKAGSTSILAMLRSSFHLVGLENVSEVQAKIPCLVARQIPSRESDAMAGPIDTVDIPVVIAARPEASSKLVRSVLDSLYDDKRTANEEPEMSGTGNCDSLRLHSASKAFFLAQRQRLTASSRDAARAVR
ncbi:MAG: serine/threonine-protein kinase [Pirellulaceae bacterium]|nr:serine/threonine-protein kinase [Pirellulaceae bacterium]